MKVTAGQGTNSAVSGLSVWNRLRTGGASLLAVITIPVPSNGAESGLIAEARRALAEHIPQAAIVKLKAALANGGIGPIEHATAIRLLAEAQLNAERPLDALETLAALSDAGDTDSMLLRSLALAGPPEEALKASFFLRGG